MSDDDEKAYRAKLAAQTMRWRLGFGVGSWGIALASSAFVALVLMDQSFVHIEGRSRLVAYAVPTIGTLLVAGYVLLRVGEIELSTGKLVRGAPVPWSRILGLVAVVAILAALVIAYPLGVYTALHATHTPCGQMVPIEVLRAHTRLRLSYASVSEEDGCDVVVSAEGHASAAVLLRERAAGDDVEWRSQLARFHPQRREPLYLEADQALLLENDDVLVIAIRDGTRARFVQLRREAFDVDDALAIARTITP